MQRGSKHYRPRSAIARTSPVFHVPALRPSTACTRSPGTGGNRPHVHTNGNLHQRPVSAQQRLQIHDRTLGNPQQRPASAQQHMHGHRLGGLQKPPASAQPQSILRRHTPHGNTLRANSLEQTRGQVQHRTLSASPECTFHLHMLDNFAPPTDHTHDRTGDQRLIDRRTGIAAVSPTVRGCQQAGQGVERSHERPASARSQVARGAGSKSSGALDLKLRLGTGGASRQRPASALAGRQTSGYENTTCNRALLRPLPASEGAWSAGNACNNLGYPTAQVGAELTAGKVRRRPASAQAMSSEHGQVGRPLVPWQPYIEPRTLRQGQKKVTQVGVR
jgi:hypothetical protein